MRLGDHAHVAEDGNLGVGGDPGVGELANDPVGTPSGADDAAFRPASLGPAVGVGLRAPVKLGDHLVLVGPTLDGHPIPRHPWPLGS